MHMGNARTALLAWLGARATGATFVLRVEDLDRARVVPGAEAALVGDLAWLGLDWDEGPDIGGSHGPYRDSERLHLYQSYATELLHASGAYYCFCSAEQLEADRAAAVAAGLPAVYPGTCLLEAGEDDGVQLRVQFLDQENRGFRQFRRRHFLLSDKLGQTKRIALGKQVNEVGCGGRHGGMGPDAASLVQRTIAFIIVAVRRSCVAALLYRPAVKNCFGGFDRHPPALAYGKEHAGRGRCVAASRRNTIHQLLLIKLLEVS